MLAEIRVLRSENEKLRAVAEKARSAIKNIKHAELVTGCEEYLGLTIAIDYLEDLNKALEALDE